MPTNGDYIRPLFPGLTLPDSTRVGLQRAIPVGPVGSAARVALASVRPGEVFSDTDWVTVSWDDEQLLGDTPIVVGFINDLFDGTALSSALWTVVSGTPTVSLGKLRLPNAFPQSQIRSVATRSFVGTSFKLYGFVATLGTPGDAYKGRGILVQDASNPGTNFLQLARVSTTLVARTNPGTIVSFPYNATTFANIGIREAGGQVYFEASSNGTTWNVLRQTTAPSWLASANVQVVIYGGAYNVAGSDSTTAGTVDRAAWQ